MVFVRLSILHLVLGPATCRVGSQEGKMGVKWKRARTNWNLWGPFGPSRTDWYLENCLMVVENPSSPHKNEVFRTSLDGKQLTTVVWDVGMLEMGRAYDSVLLLKNETTHYLNIVSNACKEA